MPPFAAQQSIFRAYDIRGARQYFTSEFVRTLGKAFAQLYKLQSHAIEYSHAACNGELTYKANPRTNTVVIGYDVRCNSDTIAHILANILNEYDELTVIHLGLITTPMMAFWAEQYDGHGIMVTASHSAKDTLGIKWLVNNGSPSGVDIQKLYQTLSFAHSENAINTRNNNKSHTYKGNNTQSISAQRHNALASTITNLPTDTIATTYIDAIAQVFTRIHQHNDQLESDNDNLITKTVSKLNLTIIIDCMHGATSNIAQRLFTRFCQRVIMLNDTPDGNFPTGNPDPTEPNRLAELQQTVIINEADIGLAFDGDGDRLMIVDNSGKVVTPDHLLYLLAQVAITERPISTKDLAAPQVLFDVKCSHHLPKLLTTLGAIPVMTKTGSSLLRQRLKACERQAIFAGELSGHFIFNDSYFIVYDDAMYAGLRLLHWLANTVANLNIIAVLNTTIYNDTDLNMVPMTTDLWGEPRAILPPYQLTDFTHNMPLLVSTADHYLPLTTNLSTNCSIVEHLSEFCRYLQRLISAPLSLKKPIFENSATGTSTLATSSSCACFTTGQHTTRAQAQRLLPAGTLLSCIDGVRLDFAHGFGVLRQSNTSHSLTVRFAGDSVADLKDIQARFVALCHPFDSQLAAQIAAIYPE
ncbi:phosphomannomutase [Psychrobacter sp. CAL346-MNA-CIBAN-0220]|uniref:phosphomannomutase n=1 Tax=Psychrobacter sp. CAL346-MNA-CIBAN-0220 TaxID=3140457 RepID=UPI003323F11D